MGEQRGLHHKYTVTKVSDGSVVNHCFVLRPERDEHAMAAMKAYAASCRTTNPELAEDIEHWLHELETERRLYG